MRLCDDGHDEVCFEGRECPCCKLRSQLEDAEAKIENLQDEINSLLSSEEDE